MQEIKTYYSESKGRTIPIHEMETPHLNHAILKLIRRKNEGLPYSPTELADMQQEAGTRVSVPRLNHNDTPTPPIETLLDELEAREEKKELDRRYRNIMEAKKEKNPAPPEFVLLNELNGLLNKLTGRTSPPIPPSFVNTLLDVVRAIKEKEKAPESELPKTEKKAVGKTTSLRELCFTNSKAGDSRLVNSLAHYDVYDLAELATLSRADFAAVCFSTVQAFMAAQAYLRFVGLDWAPTSNVLIYDGYIHPTLNPNVSPIALFVVEAERGIAKGLLNLDPTANTCKLVCVFNSIKQRVNFAVRCVGMTLLVQNIDGNSDAAIKYMNTLGVSIVFKHHVRQYIRRIADLTKRVWPTFSVPQV